MASSQTFMFVKILERESYVDDLLDGKLYAKRISWFRNVENEDGSGRNDPHEGTLLLDLLGEGSRFSIWRQDNPASRIDITAGDIDGPIQFHPNYLNNLNAFCLHAVHTGNLDWHKISDDDIERLRDKLRIDERCLTLGKYAVVITDIREFFNRIELAVGSGYYKMWHWLIRYDGPVAFSNDALDITSVFRKHPRFRYQREYRLVFDTHSTGESPRIVEIGDMRDIAHPMLSTDLNGPSLLGGNIELSVADN